MTKSLPAGRQANVEPLRLRSGFVLSEIEG